MSREDWEITLRIMLVILTITTIVAGLIAGVIRWAVLPNLQDWIERNFGKPLRETHKQVTENHHSNTQPTVLDELSDVKTEIRALRRDLADQAARFGDHITWGDREVRRLWDAIGGEPDDS